MAGGRPSSYRQDVADKLCALLSIGQSLRTACRDDDMPAVATVFNWFRSHPEFLEQYTRAKEESADALIEEMMDIADDGTNDWTTKEGKDGKVYTAVDHENINRSRLRVDTRKWVASKLKPKKYGDKVDVTSDGQKLDAGVVILPAKNDDRTS